MNPSRKERPESRPGITRTGLLLLDPALKAVALDHGASMILADCTDPAGNDSTDLCIPKQITEILRSRSWTSVSGTCLILPGINATYRCTLFRVEPRAPGVDSPMLALHFQTGISPDDTINHIADTCRLTQRELEVLRGLSTGMTSKEIATLLTISPNTVKSYIRLIMVKIGVTTRSGIVGKLLEHAAAGR